MRLWKIACAAALLPAAAFAQTTPAAPAAAPAAAASGMTVYGTALGDGWENWSWGKTELSLEVSGSARKPLKADLAGWQAVYFHHAPFSTKPYRGVSLLAQGANGGGQKLRVIAIVGGKPIEGKAKDVTLPASGWAKLDIPLGVLGAEDKEIDGLWIQNGTDQQLAPVYVAEVTFH